MIEDAMMTDQVTVNAEWLAELQRENERLQAELAEAREALRRIRQAPSQYDHALEAMHEMAQMADDALAGQGR